MGGWVGDFWAVNFGAGSQETLVGGDRVTACGGFGLPLDQRRERRRPKATLRSGASPAAPPSLPSLMNLCEAHLRGVALSVGMELEDKEKEPSGRCL